ncbi:hypothetical protein jhhlp_003213 [Lomentospora prolificans]|uniref:DNA 3'-5' helicase n=1 Tax=Lomentospora prolificans TaxID=41688 RepID=A0A2N3NG74_9PEZI|nr:hypothetical protein jhhlp_003213 [Lomentospora prolificans]
MFAVRIYSIPLCQVKTILGAIRICCALDHSIMADASAVNHPLLRTLNTAQKRAVTSNADTVAILAGPGSGKTHTLTTRVVWLVDQVGYRPCNIIVATFTVKAAREMKERIAKALGEERSKKIVLGTFHSIARRYLAVYGEKIGLSKKFVIADDSDSKAIITRICKRMENGVDPVGAKEWISKRKVRGPWDAPTRPGEGRKPDPPELLRVFEEYKDHMARHHLLDYDDLLVKGVELLKQHPSCVKNVQSVLIDEYQDTNGIQYELMKLFASAQKRITVVGDPDQSIYGWRSAEIRNLHRLLEEFPKTDEISLEENYRSSQLILSASLKVIQQDTKRYQKVLKPTHNRGTTPVLRTLYSSAVEGEWVVSEIRRVIVMSGEMLNYKDVAILLRSAALSRYLESALGKAGIPYKMVGGLKFYERVEIKLLLDYLRVIYQPDNNDPLVRIINKPKRGIGDATIKKLLEEAETSKLSLWSILLGHVRGQRKLTTNLTKAAEQRLSGSLIRIICGLRHRLERKAADGEPSIGLVSLIEDLIAQLDFRNHIEEAYPQESEGRLANVDEFLTLAGDFVRDINLEEDLPDVEDVEQEWTDTDVLGKFLANVALATDAQTTDTSEENKPAVTISTIHAAKGLEWPVVFVPAVYTGSLPHSRSEDEDEERRLLYVAMTRAQAMLYLTVPWHIRGENKVSRSHFVPDDLVKYFTTFGPSFDAKTIEVMAKILGRKAPSMTETLRKLPDMFPIEDNFMPEFPPGYEKPAGHISMIPPGGQLQGQENTWSNQAKRQHPSQAAWDGGFASPWQKDYTTTMESRAQFTMAAALPGFTTAGAHHSALAAVKPQGGTSKSHQQEPRGFHQAPSTKRPANQPTLSSFVRQGSISGFTNAYAPPTLKRPAEDELPSVPQPRKPALNPNQVGNNFNQPLSQNTIHELTKRGLQDVKRRVQARRSQAETIPVKEEGGGDDSDVEIVEVRKVGSSSKYPGFSSSPPRPEPPEKPPVKAAAAAAQENAQNRAMGYGARRPVSFHATTMGAARFGGVAGNQLAAVTNKFGGVGGAGVQRQSGLAPVEKLTRPFKPLTVNRNGNLARAPEKKVRRF